MVRCKITPTDANKDIFQLPNAKLHDYIYHHYIIKSFYNLHAYVTTIALSILNSIFNQVYNFSILQKKLAFYWSCFFQLLYYSINTHFSNDVRLNLLVDIPSEKFNIIN